MKTNSLIIRLVALTMFLSHCAGAGSEMIWRDVSGSKADSFVAEAPPETEPLPEEVPPPELTKIYMYKAGPTNANLKGSSATAREGADAICQDFLPVTLEEYAPTVTAFVSINSSDDISQIPNNFDIPLGLEIFSQWEIKIAPNWANLRVGTLTNTLNEAGVVLQFEYFWTGSEDGGTVSTNNTCGNFTIDGGGPIFGAFGTGDSTTGWMYAATEPCDRELYVLCLAY